MNNAKESSIFLRIFLSIFLLSSPIAQSQEISNPVLNRGLPKSIAISSEDVKYFGGWPIERRWYSIFIKKLQQMGAKRVFIDIAFPSADVLHPESDELFYHQLTEWPQIYLLSANDSNNYNSAVILGTKSFDPRRTFVPFSEGLSVDDGHLIFQKGKGTLVDLFLPLDFNYDKILIDLPTKHISSDWNFSQVLMENISLHGDDVIIYLNYPGITSYVLTSRTFSITTSSLQIWAIDQILTGNYELYWPWWRFLAAAFLVCIPLVTGLFIQRLRGVLVAISFAVWLLLSLILFLLKIYIPIIWFLILIPVLIFLLEKVIKMIWKNKSHDAAHAVVKISENLTEKNSDQIRELQYRLDYYEKLSTQVPVGVLSNGYEEFEIFCQDNSPLMDILRKAEQVAKDDIPVIIYGESGTGKEKLAQFIHFNSTRKNKPFIAVNCGALNDNLIESELFGYEKGAFTGAYQSKPGRFELANGGTLFLDEVSETSLSFQIKLLRVLQEGIFERVGGTKPVEVSVRIIAATHQDLEGLIELGSFREDLFYRLNGFEFFIPALRNRTGDIERLFKHFLYDTNPQIKYSEPLIEWLRAQHWPGNIRQLKSLTRRAVINAQVHNRSFLIPKDFELTTVRKDAIDDSENLSEKILQCFRDHEFHHRSISAVASDLMLHRSTVTEYLRGWVVRFLNTGNSDLEYVVSSMRGSAPVADESRFRSRIYEYIDYVRTRISDGIVKELSDQEIQIKIFRNLPGVFREDLIQLIQKIRNSKVN
jgi:DNA-binding NtrC family response regulator